MGTFGRVNPGGREARDAGRESVVSREHQGECHVSGQGRRSLVQALFTFPQSVGIAGGRPSSSYYFIGTQGDGLFYLDPHFTRPAIPLKTRAAERDPDNPSTTNPGEQEKSPVEWLLNAYSAEQLRTFHCDKVKEMPLGSLDPSMLMGFLCCDYDDWVDLRERLNGVSRFNSDNDKD